MKKCMDEHGPGLRGVIGGGLAACLVVGAAGCRQINCDEFRCRAVETVLAQVYLDTLFCCEEPGTEQCEGLNHRYDQLMGEIKRSHAICLERDWIRLRAIWKEIRGLLLLRNTVGQLLGYLCEDYPVLMSRNETMVFSDADRFEFDGMLQPTGPARPIGPWTRSSNPEDFAVRLGMLHSPVGFQTTFACAPGASLAVDTWLGRETFALEGEVAIVHEMPEIEDDPCGVIAVRSLDLQFSGEHVQGTLAFDVDHLTSHCVFDEDGRGVITGVADIRAAASGLPGVTLEEIFGERFAVAIPFALSEGALVLAPQGPINGLEFFPLSDDAERHSIEALALVRGAEGSVAGGGSCHEQARERVEVLKDIFRSCYPTTPELSGP